MLKERFFIVSLLVSSWLAQGQTAYSVAKVEADLKIMIAEIPGVRIQRSSANVLLDGSIDNMTHYKKYRRVVDSMLRLGYPIVDVVEFSDLGRRKLAHEIEDKIYEFNLRDGP